MSDVLVCRVKVDSPYVSFESKKDESVYHIHFPFKIDTQIVDSR